MRRVEGGAGQALVEPFGRPILPMGLMGGGGGSDLRRSRREERGGDGDGGSRVGRLREFHSGYEDGIVSG